MKNNLIQNLEKLCKQPGVSGFERESGISDFLFEMIKNINPDTVIDAAGNIVSTVKNPGRTIILEAHMDEVGFVVGDKKSKIILSPQGIIKGEKVAGCDVFVVGKDIKGKIAINSKDDFIFMPKKENDRHKIDVGDIVAFKRTFYINRDKIRASALDNRIGCSVLVEILANVVKNGSKNRLVFVFSRKEEIDKSSFESIVGICNNAFAIVIDAAYAQPVEFDFDESDVLISVLGKGCVIQTKGKGFAVLKSDIEEIKKIAKEKRIKIQEERAPKGFGKTNLAKMQKQGLKRGIVINVPVKDQHYQLAATSLFDANEAVRLILKILDNMPSDCGYLTLLKF